MCVEEIYLCSKLSYSYRLELTMNNTSQELSNRFPICFSSFRMKDENERKALTVTYACITPFIIGANLLLIFGIIKTKRNKFNASQILFLTLFLSDLLLGVAQLPMTIYLMWKPSNPTCSEIALGSFSILFPIVMSGTTLCVISIERYFNVVHNMYQRKIVTNKSVTITIIIAILISTTWALLVAFHRGELDKRKISTVCITASSYIAIIIVITAILNVCLLRNVKQKMKTSALHQTLNAKLTKTIAIILATLLVLYLPILIIFLLAAYFTDFPDPRIKYKIVRTRPWILILPQINTVANSVIYFAANNQMKRYYHKLFNCRQEEKDLKCPASLVLKRRCHGQPAS